MLHPHRLLVTEPGGDNPVAFDLTGWDGSWSVLDPGSVSAEVRTKDLVAAYGTTDLRGYWTRWEHPTLGGHTGVIEDTEDTLESGTTELAGRELAATLAKRRVPARYDVVGASPGGLAKRAISDASADSATWVTRHEVDESGEPLTITTRAEALFDLIDDLARRSASEWRIDAGEDSDRPQNGDLLVFRWGRPLGADRSASAYLCWGREIVAGRLTRSLRPLVNDLLVLPADDRYASQRFVLEDDASIEERDRLQDTLVVEGKVTKSVLLPVARAELARLLSLGRAATLEVRDLNGCWAGFRQGDRVTIDLPPLNARGVLTVKLRSYSLGSGRLTIAGEFVEDAP